MTTNKRLFDLLEKTLTRPVAPATSNMTIQMPDQERHSKAVDMLAKAVDTFTSAAKILGSQKVQVNVAPTPISITVPQQKAAPAPIVNVAAPTVHVAAPTVNVAAPILKSPTVNVSTPQPKVHVDVHVPEAKAVRKEQVIERDADNLIKRTITTETPIKD